MSNHSIIPWADRTVDKVPNYKEPLSRPDNDDEPSSSKLFTVLENMGKVLKESFLKGMPNSSQRQVRERFGDPKYPPPQQESLSLTEW